MDTNLTASQSIAPYCDIPAISNVKSSPISASGLPSPTQPPIAEQIPQFPAMHQADYLQLCQQIVQLTLNSPDLTTTLHKAAITLCSAFQVEGCLIAIAQQPSSQPSSQWLLGWHSASFNPSALLEHPAIKLMLTGSTPTIVLDAHANSWEEAWQKEVQAILGTTIQPQSGSNGVIVLMRSQPHTWTDAEIGALKATSSQIAIAVVQRYLHEQQHKQSQYRAVVNQLTLAIRNSVELPDILKQAIEGTAQALQVDRGLILRLKYWDSPLKGRSIEQIPKAKATVVCEWLNMNSNTHDSAGEADQSPSPNSCLDESFWVSGCSLCQQLLVNSLPAIVLNMKEDCTSTFATDNIAPVFDLDAMPALLLFPLESQNTVLGFLALQHRHPRIWQAEELELVELVSAQISTAIIQTETLRQVQALVDKRTVQLRQSLELQSKLYEKTRQQIDQLRQLNQLKDEFIDTISHELRTPLTSMTMAIRMLREAHLSPERSTKYLDILEQQCAQEISLINDLLALQELESRQVVVQLQQVNLTELVEDAAQMFRQRWENKGLTLQLQLPESAIVLQTDPNSLRSILQELLTNAGKYSDPNSDVRLQVAWQRESAIEQIVISLHNIGRGISEEELPLIFEKFRRGQGATQNAIQGTGLGLALVKSLVQHINGTIEVTSHQASHQPTFETCFTLTLPCELDPAKL